MLAWLLGCLVGVLGWLLGCLVAWFVQRQGRPAAVRPDHDSRKGIRISIGTGMASRSLTHVLVEELHEGEPLRLPVLWVCDKVGREGALVDRPVEVWCQPRAAITWALLETCPCPSPLASSILSIYTTTWLDSTRLDLGALLHLSTSDLTLAFLLLLPLARSLELILHPKRRGHRSVPNPCQPSRKKIETARIYTCTDTYLVWKFMGMYTSRTSP